MIPAGKFAHRKSRSISSFRSCSTTVSFSKPATFAKPPRMLTNEDLKRIQWDPESIDWADYWVNIHTKGIEKWIRPVFTRQK